MKYLIKQRVINGDRIRQAQYMPEDETVHEASACFIDLGGRDAECDWDVVLRGTDADRFWEAYSGDAYAVVTK